MLDTLFIFITWVVVSIACSNLILQGAKKLVKENKDTTLAQKLGNRVLTISSIVALLGFTTFCLVFCLVRLEKTRKTVISEKSYTIISTSQESEDKCIDMTIQDESGVIAIVTYGMPDYPHSVASFFGIQSPIIDELQPNGDSNSLIIQECKDGSRKVILEGMAGGELSAVLESYNLKMEVQ